MALHENIPGYDGSEDTSGTDAGGSETSTGGGGSRDTTFDSGTSGGDTADDTEPTSPTDPETVPTGSSSKTVGPTSGTGDSGTDRTTRDTTPDRGPRDGGMLDPEQTAEEAIDQDRRDRVTGLENDAPEGTYVIGNQVVDESTARERIKDRVTDATQLTDEDIAVSIGAGGTITYELTDTGAERFEGAPGEQIGTGEVPTTQEAARDLEQQAIERTAATNRGDVKVTTQDGELRAELTYVGSEKQAAQELGVSISDIDMEDGQIVPTTEEGREAIKQNAIGAQSSQGGGSRTTTADSGTAPGAGMDGDERAISRLEDELGVDLDRDDVEVTQEGNRTEVALTDEGQRTVREANEAFDDPTIMIPGQVAGVNVPGGGKSVETVLRDFQMGVDKWAERNVQSGPQTSKWAQMGIEPADRGPRQKAITGWSEVVGQSLASTPALLATVPLAAKEVYGWGAEGVRTDEKAKWGEKTFSEAYKRGAGEASYAWNNPGEASARLVGSLAGTGLIMGGAAAVSSRAGAASRWTIQPGEELAGTVGYRATRRLRNQRTAERYFPNQEPLIFSEEAAIRGVKRARDTVSPKARAAANRARSEFETFVDADRAQMQIGRTETESETETITAEDIDSEVTGGRPGTLPGNEGAGVDTSEPTAGGNPWPDYMLPEGHPMRSDTEAKPVDTELEGRRRVEEAQRPNARVYETAVAGEQSATEPSVTADVTRAGMLARAQAMRAQAQPEAQGVGVRELENAADRDLATEVETETETRARARARTEVETRLDFETEYRRDPPTETDPETDGDENDPAWGVDMQSADGQAGTDSPVDMDAGWINKWATALAGGGIDARRAPEDVENYAGDPLPAPTVAQIEGETEAVEDFFDFGADEGGWP